MKYAVDPSILRETEQAELAWAAIAPIWNDLPLHPQSALNDFMAQLTEGQRALIAVDWCQKEVRNGGFAQLFANTTGNLIPWAVPGFRLIEAMSYANVFASAAATLGEPYPASASSRKKALASLDELTRQALGRLEDDFYDLLEADNLERYRGEYVRAHPDQFVLPSKPWWKVW